MCIKYARSPLCESVIYVRACWRVRCRAEQISSWSPNGSKHFKWFLCCQFDISFFTFFFSRISHEILAKNRAVVSDSSLQCCAMMKVALRWFLEVTNGRHGRWQKDRRTICWLPQKCVNRMWSVSEFGYILFRLFLVCCSGCQKCKEKRTKEKKRTDSWPFALLIVDCCDVASGNVGRPIVLRATRKMYSKEMWLTENQAIVESSYNTTHSSFHSPHNRLSETKQWNRKKIYVKLWC